MGRKGGPQGRRGGGKQMAEPELSDSGDEQVIEDAFAQGKNKISLQGGDVDSDEIDLEAVYDLSDTEGDSEDDEDEDEDVDDEPDLDEEIERGGRAGRLAKQAKYLEERLKLQQGEDEDEKPSDDEEGRDELRERLWGASKRAYYGGDDAEADSDEDALRDEEEEAVRLQAGRAARLDDADFGLGDDGLGAPLVAAAADAKDGKAAAAKEAKEGPAKEAKKAKKGLEVEAVERDLSALGTEERMAALLSDAPELVSLLDELKGSLAEVRHRVGPVLAEVREGGLATPEGLSYLEARQLLLLQYAACITAYLLLKAEGRSAKNHPVIGRLVQLRTYLERLSPVDRTLAYQVDKLLRTTRHVRAAGVNPEGDDGADPGGAEGPRAAQRRRRDEEREQQQEEERRAEEQQRAEAEAEAKRRKAKKKRRSLAKELAQDTGAAPEPRGPAAAAAALAARQRQEAMRAAAEEDGGGGAVALSRLDAKRLRAQKRAGLGGGLLDEFADDVTDAQQAAAGAGGGGASLTGLFGRQRLSQKFGADITAQLRAGRGGDDDLPAREPLYERRAKYDAVAARKAAAAGGGDDEDMEDEYDYEAAAAGRKRRSRDEAGGDDFYAEAAAARAATKAEKWRRHEAPALAPPLEDPSAEGQRPISYAIQKNRGLTPHRRKDLKNPRKKHRIKFKAAQVRRKGQVQGVREAPGAGYAGEATGVKSNVTKSRKLR